MRRDLWIIESRVDGKLDFSDPQPERIFGHGAIHGMTEDAMARVVWRHKPDAVMSGTDIALWPRHIDARWTARRKTW
jgi:hypothetical protein